MTMGLGMACGEGLLLVADSLEPVLDLDDPRYPFYLDDRKIQWLQGSTIALVMSGFTNDDELRANGVGPDYHPLADWCPVEDPRVRARRAHGALQRIDAGVRARHPGYDRYADFDDPGPHTLFAVGCPSGGPLLGKFTSKTETWAKPGDVFAIGGWLLGMYPELAEEMSRKAPDSLEDGKLLVANWVQRFMQKVFGYQDAGAMAREKGIRPCVSWPLQVVAMTASHFTREELPCPPY